MPKAISVPISLEYLEDILRLPPDVHIRNGRVHTEGNTLLLSLILESDRFRDQALDEWNWPPSVTPTIHKTTVMKDGEWVAFDNRFVGVRMKMGYGVVLAFFNSGQLASGFLLF